MIEPTQAVEQADVADAFRLAMRRFAATVSVISVQRDGTRHAMTATSVTSLSMTPPSLLFCVYRESRFHSVLRNHEYFCINVLCKSQAAISEAFAKPSTAHYDRFEWNVSGDFCYLTDAQAVMFCKLSEKIEFATHMIFVGLVTNVIVRDCASPLIFQNGQYGSYTPILK